MSKSKFGTGIILGAIGGAIAALLLTPKTGKDNRKILKKKYEELQAFIEEKELKQKVVEVMGEAGEKAEAVYTVTKKELNKALTKAQDSLKDMDSNQYTAMVSEVLDTVKKEVKVSSEKLEKIGSYLEKRWKGMVKDVT